MRGTVGPLHVHAPALQLLADNPERALDLSERLAGTVRARGLIGGLPHMLLVQTEAAIALGQLVSAVTVGGEALRLAEQTGQRRAATSASAALAYAMAWSGEQHRCHELAAAAEHGRSSRADADSAMALLARCLLDAGTGHPAEALERWRGSDPELLDHPVTVSLGLPEWIEAAARTGDIGRVSELLDRYELWACGHQGAAARAVAHRCRALLGIGDEARSEFEAALRPHRRTHRPLAQARTELAYGEWLRRARRPIAARARLRAAYHRFVTAGAHTWAGRARTELRAAGETVDAESSTPVGTALSAQELQVARLAAAGRTNREIGAELFLRPRTVGYHLHKIYTKLGITSRHDLVARGILA
ncbi:MAG TPA: helix-turn-helix transcriptional regulator [Kribbella sp.]|nr:helix-turn-helix transcriptional regulator [Kribbella sp.]